MWLIVGLGNPKEEHFLNRHNTGFLVLDEIFGKKDWIYSASANTFFKKGKEGSQAMEILKPQTYMNKSGVTVGYLAKKHKVPTKQIIVIHDDIDLPFGTFKFSFNRGSGGHNGVESIRKVLKTKEFIRLRIGISPVTPTGKLRKPKGEDKVYKYLLSNFTPKQHLELKKITKTVARAITTAVTEGKEKAMSLYNS